MTTTGRHMLLMILLAMLAGPVALGRSGEPGDEPKLDADRAATIKAGMVLNFIRYTEWPAGSFGSDQGPIVLTVVGEGDLRGKLEKTVAGQLAHGRSIEIRRLAHPTPLPGESAVAEERMQEFRRQLLESHAVLIGESERDRAASVLQSIGNADILTISDLDGFAERGGMLGLAVRNNRVAIDANPGAIKGTRLDVSSRLLRLARTVETEGK